MDPERSAFRLPLGFLPGAVRGSARGWLVGPLATNDAARRRCEDLASPTGTSLRPFFSVDARLSATPTHAFFCFSEFRGTMDIMLMIMSWGARLTRVVVVRCMLGRRNETMCLWRTGSRSRV